MWVSFVLSAGLFWVSAVRYSLESLFAHAPEIVVRRIGLEGWVPMPEETGRAAAERVIGVRGVQERMWGVAACGGRSCVVIGLNHADLISQVDPYGSLSPGRAWIGPEMTGSIVSGKLDLVSATSMSLEVQGVLPETLAWAQGDSVFVCEEDARSLLGLPAGHVTDLAIHVFHESEQEALLPDLWEAMPWPVEIDWVARDRKLAAGRVGRLGGLTWMFGLPLCAALLVLAVALEVQSRHRHHESWLMNALGWTVGDLAAVAWWRCTFLCIPPALIGMLLAYVGLFVWPAPHLTFLLHGLNGLTSNAVWTPHAAVPQGLKALATIMTPLWGVALLGTFKASDPGFASEHSGEVD